MIIMIMIIIIIIISSSVQSAITHADAWSGGCVVLPPLPQKGDPKRGDQEKRHSKRVAVCRLRAKWPQLSRPAKAARDWLKHPSLKVVI